MTLVAKGYRIEITTNEILKNRKIIKEIQEDCQVKLMPAIDHEFSGSSLKVYMYFKTTQKS